MTAIAIVPRTEGARAGRPGDGILALQRAAESPIRFAPPLPATAEPGPLYLQWLLVPDRGDGVALPVARIDWIAAEDNYLRIHAGTRGYLIRETMERLSGLLDPAVFLRIHRSTLVNLNRVKAFRRWGARDHLVVLENGTELRMSRTYHRALGSTVGDYR
ncbi:MAG TPA: LytTR family DNA-binding domain-containing protein [Longimicrobium sp.]